MNPSIRHSTSLPEGTPHVPAAIVGAGACGLVAALSLRNAGVECVVLERDAQPSGSTALSSGLIPACGTRMQRALGITDSVAVFSQDITNKAHGTAAPHLVQAYASAVGPAIDMLADRHGLNFHVQEGFLFPSHSVPRMHSVAEKTGAALVGYLERAAQAAGADIMTEATVRTLWVDDTTRRVAGVSFERPDGTLEHLRCDALVLACTEYNYSLAPALKNILDWASREPDHALLAGKPVAIMGAGGGMGTSRAQYHLRQVCVFLDLRPLNKPEVFANAFAGGFDADGNLIDEKLTHLIGEQMRVLVAQVVAARR